MYKSAIINRLDITFKQQKKDYDTLKLKYTESIDFTNSTNPKNSSTKVCLTDNCILLSGNIYSSLDTSVDPCEDFYEYSCGNWLKKALIPRGYPRWSTIVSRSYANQLVLKDELEKYSFINSTEDNNSGHDLINAEIKTVLFYKSCIDNDGNIEKLKAQPFLNIVNKFINKNENNTLVFNDTFENILFYVHIKFGLAAYFQMGVMDDDKNSSYNDIEAREIINIFILIKLKIFR
jgi:predicted metalloendopeptidase